MLAYRDLGRNRRRSLLTLIAVALGLALLIVMNGFIAGIMEDSLQNSIRLRTGHLQIRAGSYAEEQLSLKARDLLANPEKLAERAAALGEVKAAAPVLWAGGILNTISDSAGVQLYGIQTDSALYDPVRSAIVAGEFLNPEERNTILIGKRLADTLGVQTGQRLTLTVVDADGNADTGTFTIGGLFKTGVPSYDENAVFMTHSRAQAFTRSNGRASAIVVLLNDQADTATVAAALRTPEVNVLTWTDLNQLFVQAVQTGMNFYIILDVIVMLIVAVIIANTLLMSVFERIREMGILAALGMKGRQIMQLFLVEAAILGLAGVAVGIGLGLAGVGYLATNGVPIGDQVATSGGAAVAIATTMYAHFVPGTFAGLSVAMLLIILLAAVYPAWYAARLQPVEALHG
jgi:ABC-type lipoprotein release transport system permease subunit